MTVRRFRAPDAPVLWALNNLPNVGATADPDAPLPLPPAQDPPAAFPDLADIPAGYLRAGGDFLVAERDGHLVGMGGIRPTGAGTAEVRRLRVHPAVRRQGIGRSLLAALEQRARDLGLHRMALDTADNQPEAVAFYRALGYDESGRESHPDWSWTLVYFTKPLNPE
ncbi:hypothetical protein GCM10009557_47400 [Virgisporangium ochraceum]|uniref:N-acetyltransferase domain-containing protein n=1 Tax=Virgisporangium ochraceum TaxID=65505 RepID=A0A8J3ZMC5_9ACTN|nr:GNAT family N-acetyltransferase [Virgisporangium ochraceum]GIJ66964.1 hypothetical protein Voc01_018810 [Virgisporangium ochraceum]